MNVFELFKESYGVGVVASKKQAKDPRYSHSLTKDVRPDTPKKNAKALMLASKNLNEAPGDAISDENLANILKLIAGLESGGKNIKNQAGSGAFGFYQFLPDTFERVKAKLDDNHPYKNASWEDFKKNTDIQDSYAQAGMLDNVRYLNNKKIPVNVETIYNAHHFGPFVASLMHENPDRTLKDIYEKNKNMKGMPSWETIKKQNPYLDDDATGASTVAYHKQRAEDPDMKDFYDNAGVNVASLYNQDEVDLPDEAPTVAATPKADDQTDRKAELQKIIDDSKDRLGGIATQAGRDAYLELQRIKKAEKQAQSEREDARRTARSRQNAIATLQKEFQDAMERGDGKAMNDIMASVRGLGGSQAAQQVAQGTFEPTTVSVTPEKEEEKSYAEMGKEALPDSLSLKEKELEDAKEKLIAITPNGTQEEVAQAQADVDELERAVQYNKDVKAGRDVVGGVSTLSKDETEYLKAKQGALLQGKDDVTSIADDDLNRRRAEAIANQLEGEGKPKEADKARAEAARHEALRNEKLTKGITWGQGTLAQQEQQMKQWDKTKSEGGDPAQSWKGGTITDPAKLKDWQERNREADKLQKEKGQWDITKTVDDYKADVSSWGQEVQKAEAEKEPVDMSKVGKAGTDDFMKSGPAEKPKVSATPEPEPEKVEPDDISGDFNTTKQRQHYRDKYHALTPAFMMDEPDKQAVIARERLKRKAGELMRTNPAEWSKLYGGDKLGKAIEKAEQDAYAKFDAPTVATQPKPQAAKAKVPEVPTSEPKSAIGKVVSGNQTYAGGRAGPGSAASTKTLQQVQQERQAKLDQQKAEQEAKKAEQQAKAEAQKAEQERKRQEAEAKKAEEQRRQAARNTAAPMATGVGVQKNMNTSTLPKVGESAIFRAIMRK